MSSTSFHNSPPEDHCIVDIPGRNPSSRPFFPHLVGALSVVLKAPPLHFFDPVFMRLLIDMIQPPLTDRGCTHDHNPAELTNNSNIIVGQRLWQIFRDFEANRHIPPSLNGLVSLEIKLLHIDPLFPSTSDTRVRVFESPDLQTILF